MAEGDTSLACDLDDTFNRAANHLQHLVSKLDTAQLLKFYGLYKQATVGPCNAPRPKWFHLQAKDKWDAWNSLGSMSKEQAMEGYVRALLQVDPHWEQQNQSDSASSKAWVAVSCLYNDEKQLCNADKKLLDWIKESDEEAVRKALNLSQSEVNLLDEEGMMPIHWAADRGNMQIVKLLIDAGADKDATDDDGQTPLHYAASCGHVEVVTYLLSIGANIFEDNTGLTPKEVATGTKLVSLF